jgi:hypothetical protein
MNVFAPTHPATTPPGARLSVTLTAAQWRVIERQLGKGKYRHVNRIMEDLRAQLALAGMRAVQTESVQAINGLPNQVGQSAYNNWPGA